jgi:hypothetical protein
VTPAISLEALRLGRACLLGVELATGMRAAGATMPNGDPVPYRRTVDHAIVGLTRSTVIAASVLVPTRRTSFSLVTGTARTTAVEHAIYPAHLERLHALLGVDPYALEAT